jgi:hypothetical protein
VNMKTNVNILRSEYISGTENLGNTKKPLSNTFTLAFMFALSTFSLSSGNS